MNRNLPGFIAKAARVLLLSIVCITANAQASRILVVYFSQPENASLAGVDGVSGASLLQKNGTTMGSNAWIAQLIQSQTNATLFRIETVTPYPTEHQPLLDFAENEQRQGARPQIKSRIEDFASYDTVFVGFPVWWYKMPMVMYSFFEQYDFSGKTIIPFTVHGGSRFADSLSEIKRLQPKANLVTSGLAISRSDILDKDIPDTVFQWLTKLDLNSK